MSDPRGKCPDFFYETMDDAKLQRLQSEYMAIWDQFKLHAEARGVWRMALRMMDDVWLQSRIRGNYEKLRRQLGSGKVAERVADVIADRISSGQPQTKG